MNRESVTRLLGVGTLLLAGLAGKPLGNDRLGAPKKNKRCKI